GLYSVSKTELNFVSASKILLLFPERTRAMQPPNYHLFCTPALCMSAFYSIAIDCTSALCCCAFDMFAVLYRREEGDRKNCQVAAKIEVKEKCSKIMNMMIAAFSFETIGYTSFTNMVKPIERFQLRLVLH
ncbi:hypothetical protein, partial [Enterobacter hormaechei]|uniref:hypothetical protein n=1 Tax=Enterobacter hormaechei TaxID=158836 RepID=UPI0023E424FE